MIRRKRFTKAQQDLREYKKTAPISIGLLRDEARSRDEESAVIRAVRAIIWSTRHSCQLCHGARRKECIKDDEMHEEPPRSQTRGRPPTERFNVRVCGRLCQACHRDVTEHRLTIRFTDATKGFLAPVYAVRT